MFNVLSYILESFDDSSFPILNPHANMMRESKVDDDYIVDDKPRQQIDANPAVNSHIPRVSSSLPAGALHNFTIYNKHHSGVLDGDTVMGAGGEAKSMSPVRKPFTNSAAGTPQRQQAQNTNYRYEMQCIIDICVSICTCIHASMVPLYVLLYLC